jgi:3-dehydroquinate synthase
MKNDSITFNFGRTASTVHVGEEPPAFDAIAHDRVGTPPQAALLVCDTNTRSIAGKIAGNSGAAVCVLEAGETAKNWASVEQILYAAKDAGLGRDALFIGVGGGVVTDLAAFAAAVYMRGVQLALVSTSLLGMVDAALGGKTGFDLFGVKNLAGVFYPAPSIYLPLAVLKTLPQKELKSGLAEIIKTMLLDEEQSGAIHEKLCSLREPLRSGRLDGSAMKKIKTLVIDAVSVKGRIVEEDPQETGNTRALLNLGHTFGHALEARAGLGRLTHGEAVAWGIARACNLGAALGITPKDRGEAVIALLDSFGYETRAPHPLAGSADGYTRLLRDDKKKKDGKLRFIVPDAKSAVIVTLENEQAALLRHIINGGADS